MGLAWAPGPGDTLLASTEGSRLPGFQHSHHLHNLRLNRLQRLQGVSYACQAALLVVIFAPWSGLRCNPDNPGRISGPHHCHTCLVELVSAQKHCKGRYGGGVLV